MVLRIIILPIIILRIIIFHAQINDYVASKNMYVSFQHILTTHFNHKLPNRHKATLNDPT
jgi:hypothetical protein